MVFITKSGKEIQVPNDYTYMSIEKFAKEIYQQGRADERKKIIDELLSVKNRCDNCYSGFCESCNHNGEYALDGRIKYKRGKEIRMVTSIIDLIPLGFSNAISREELTRLCDEFGLIEPDTVDKDRAMRQLMRKAKREVAILSRQFGGYFRPDVNNTEDVVEIRKYILREQKRAKSVFASLKKAYDLLEDCEHNRFENMGLAYNPYQE